MSDTSSSVCLFDLPPDAMDSDDDIAAEAARVSHADVRTRSARTYTMEREIIYGVEGAGMPEHNHADADLKATEATWLPGLASRDAHNARGLNAAYENAADLPVGVFESKYMAGEGVPCVIRGVAKEAGWRALDKWTSEAAFLDHYGDVPLHITEIFPMGEFGKPHAIRVPARMYMEYAAENTVDHPYYPFERDFTSDAAKDEGRAGFLADFSVPKYFKNDVYALSGPLRAVLMKHTFVLLGGQRTGAPIHQDPMGTGAWNTLLAGTKKWVFFPPSTDPSAILEEKRRAASCAQGDGAGASMTMGKCPPESPVNWWLDVYPRLIAKPAGGGPSEAERLGMVEVMQGTDETIYTPPYWYHAVLNVTDFTLAVTGNIVTLRMLREQWGVYKQRYPEAADIVREELPRVVPDTDALAFLDA